MGLIDRLFGKPKATGVSDSRFETLTAYSPVFTSWGGQIYESELVRAAVDAKARHVAKLKYGMKGTAGAKLLTATRTAPNPWYTWPQFLERCSNIYDIQNNLFIVPVLDKTGEVTGFFPVLPSSCEVVNHGGVPYLKYSFMNGQKRSMELSRCAVITKHQLNDDFFGEKNTALDPTMQLVNMVNQGIMEGMIKDGRLRCINDNDLMKVHMLDAALKFEEGTNRRRLIKMSAKQHIDGMAALSDAICMRHNYYEEMAGQLSNER